MLARNRSDRSIKIIGMFTVCTNFLMNRLEECLPCSVIICTKFVQTPIKCFVYDECYAILFKIIDCGFSL